MRARSPRQVIAPGDEGVLQLFAAGLTHQCVIMSLPPHAASALMCVPAVLSRGHVIVSIIRVLQALNFSKFLRDEGTFTGGSGAFNLFKCSSYSRIIRMNM